LETHLHTTNVMSQKGKKNDSAHGMTQTRGIVGDQVVGEVDELQVGEVTKALYPANAVSSKR